MSTWNNGKSYDVYGRKGWSESFCGQVKEHGEHVWNNEHHLYGPYTCTGWPVYKPKHAKED